MQTKTKANTQPTVHPPLVKVTMESKVSNDSHRYYPDGTLLFRGKPYRPRGHGKRKFKTNPYK